MCWRYSTSVYIIHEFHRKINKKKTNSMQNYPKSMFFAFLVWKFDVLFVGLLVVFFLMDTLNRRGRYYY